MRGWIETCAMFWPVTGTHAPALPTPGVNALHGSWTSAHVVASGGIASSIVAFLQSLAVALLQRPLSLTAIVSSIPRLTLNRPDGDAPLIENARPVNVGAFRQALVVPADGK